MNSRIADDVTPVMPHLAAENEVTINVDAVTTCFNPFVREVKLTNSFLCRNKSRLVAEEARESCYIPLKLGVHVGRCTKCRLR